MSENPKLYHFYVGEYRFETDKSSLTGAEIKSLAAVTPTHQLFYRDDVNAPDRLIRDTETVEMVPNTALGEPISDDEAIALDAVDEHGHFYAVPNTSYKRLKSNP
ncbi:MAG: multiubiquitin domain-containing protein [Acidobacteriaceae bacterium]|nr:multiubiquitin domain-containing protein [Acidobacteriaceae bacterium]